MQSVIAISVYSLKDNSTIVGWAGGIDFNVLNKELQSLNITSLDDNTRVIYVGHNGQKVADSDMNKSEAPESFATLDSFKNAINGQSVSILDVIVLVKSKNKREWIVIFLCQLLSHDITSSWPVITGKWYLQ